PAAASGSGLTPGARSVRAPAARSSDCGGRFPSSVELRWRSRSDATRPGAQLSFSDADGHRFQVLLTNQHGDPVTLEARHRARAGVEDAIRAAKDSGLRNLPFREFAPNAAWLELVLIAQDLTSWAQQLLLEGDLVRAE